jgi:H+/Cl- antiporter ClcA
MSGAAPSPDPATIMRSRQFVGLLVIAAGVGVVTSFAAWWFLELVHKLQHALYDELPEAVGFDTVPAWWPLPVLVIAGVLVALAVARLPGAGGHSPVEGLDPGTPTQPVEIPGVLLAAAASIALGAVVGPEAPLLALGAGLGLLVIGRLRSDAPPEASTIIAASGTFAALSFLFGSPVIAAVLLIEAAGLAGAGLSLVLIPGLLAAGIGTLVSIGLGAWTGIDRSDISLGVLELSEFARPDAVDFLWTVPLAAAVGLGVVVIFRLARGAHGFVGPRPFLLPVAGLLVGALAIGFSEATDKGIDQVLFSGQEALGPLVANADTWSLSALALLIGFKGLAYAVSLASFRGGPVFPAILLGAAAGLMAAQLPGLELTPAVAVCIGAAVVAVLRLPLSAVVMATLLTSQAGLGVGPLVILGVVVAFLVANLVDPPAQVTLRRARS